MNGFLSTLNKGPFALASNNRIDRDGTRRIQLDDIVVTRSDRSSTLVGRMEWAGGLVFWSIAEGLDVLCGRPAPGIKGDAVEPRRTWNLETWFLIAVKAAAILFLSILPYC